MTSMTKRGFEGVAMQSAAVGWGGLTWRGASLVETGAEIVDDLVIVPRHEERLAA